MLIDKNELQGYWRNKAKDFVGEYITPYANKFALEGGLPPSFFKEIARNRFLGTLVNPAYNGLGLDYRAYGLVTEEFGYGCSSVRSLLTVHDMVGYAIEQFGDERQKQAWLPRLVEGSIIAAFALTEPNLGSSIDKISTRIESNNNNLYLYGRKVWISFGQIADLLLVFAKLNNHPVAVLVPTNLKNIKIEPINNSLGMTASMLAEIHMEGALIEKSHILGFEGMGINFIANQCLMLGRFSVASGSCGIIRACLEACEKKVLEVRPDKSILINHQLIAGLMTDMLTSYKVTSLLCKNAGEKLQYDFYGALEDVMIAKYASARNAYKTAGNAIQVFGAEGCSQDSPLRRWLHDAKVSELIEGSSEVMRATIGKLFIGNKH